MRFALQGALSRHAALGIRHIGFDFLEHPGRDGGVRTNGPKLLELKKAEFSHAMLVLDYEGSGTNAIDAISLEQELDEKLRSTWGNAAKAIVIDPELDVWMWGSDNALSAVLGSPSEESIRDWLRNQDFQFTDLDKPVRPKEAMEKLLAKLRRPRSSSIYEKIAGRISFKRCTDPAFLRLRSQLEGWFPADI